MGKAEEKDKLLTVGELAHKVGVTVRTLQYYDSNGLLSPRGYSEGGRRMYDRRDIIRLHQILFLKSFGFSLEEIRDRLLPTESASELAHMFKNQRELLVNRIAHLQEAVNLIDQVTSEVRISGEIGIERMFVIINAIRVGNPYSFMLRHMSPEQIDHYYNLFENEAVAVKYNDTSKALTAKLFELYQRNEDPAGTQGQKLAGEWWDLIMSMTNGDPVLIQNIMATGSNDDNWPPDMLELKQATTDFLGQALGAYWQNNNIPVPMGGTKDE